MSQRMKTVVVAIIALLLVLSLVLPAFAHAQLVSSSPESGASVPTAEELVLTFNEDVSPDFVTFYAQGDSEGVLDGDPTVDGAVVTQPLAPTRNGEYAIGYRVVSADGHPVSGEITFTLTDVTAAAQATDEETTGAGEAATDGADTAQPEVTTEATETTETTASETVTADQTDEGDDEGGSNWILFAVIFGITFALTLLLMRMRSRRTA